MATLLSADAPQDEEAFDFDKFFELKLAAQAEWAKRNPQPRHVERTIETDKPIGLVFTSDWHIGGVGTRHLQLRDDMQLIADHPQLFAYVGGDWNNNYILPALAHAGANDVFSAGDQQYEVTLRIVSIILHKMVALGSGNHNNWTLRMAGLDPRWLLFRDVPYLCTRDGSVLHLKVGEQTYRIFRRHRHRWSSVFNPAHAVVAEYQRNPFDFDIGVIEHQHMSHGADFEGKERPDGSTTRIAIRPGTYKVEDSYSDEHGFYYASSEQQAVILWPDRFQMLRVRGLPLLVELLDALGR